MDQATPEKPTWRARLGAAWQAVKTKAAAWGDFTGPKDLITLLPAALVGGVLGWTLYKLAPLPAAEPRTTPAVETAPGLQDQINALRLRVIVLEARADALPKPAVAPRASAPRAGASTPAAPDPDQFADTSELVEPPIPPAPITRQSVDQFRASLRTPQPVQE